MTPPTVQFIPAAGGGYLQEITWTMTSNSTATVSSTGLDIIWASQTGSLAYQAGRPRLYNGLEAVNYGATANFWGNAFASTAACRAWWDNYQIETRLNGGVWETLGDPVFGSAQPHYLNTTGNTSQTGTAWVSGDIVDFRVWDAT